MTTPSTTYVPATGDTFTYGSCAITGCTCSAHVVHTARSIETDSFTSGGMIVTTYRIRTDSVTVVLCPGVNHATKINQPA
jgi:hypothetical protein